jgi:hypothetical protein
MPLAGIQLLFETLVQCTRELCKCEMRENGSKDCNLKPIFFREPPEIMQEKNAAPQKYGSLCCDAGLRSARSVIRRHERAPLQPRCGRFCRP